VLLCDEPTGALDYATGKLVLEVIARINRELGTTAVVITHNAAIAGMADRVIHLGDGRIQRVERNAHKLAVGAVVVVSLRMKALDRKLLRDLRLMWSQALTIALVVASGIGGFITTCRRWTRWRWRATASTPRGASPMSSPPSSARRALADTLRALPGVADVQTTTEFDGARRDRPAHRPDHRPADRHGPARPPR
jgi:energy-coupling factor transporter ATP-binding protein EcfA2